jgi:hypothetical protein
MFAKDGRMHGDGVSTAGIYAWLTASPAGIYGSDG